MTDQFDIHNDENKPIRDIAYEKLKHSIITGELPPGYRIVETVYANKLHISRTPLREALRKLELEGLVQYELRKGVIVCAFTISDIDEIFTIRNAMMMLLLPSVIEQAGPEDIRALRDVLRDMDVALARQDGDALAVYKRQVRGKMEHISDKKRILNVIDSQEEYIIRFSSIAISNYRHREQAQYEHHQMVDLIEQRNLEGLEKLMNSHLEESRQTCLDALRGKQRGKSEGR